MRMACAMCQMRYDPSSEAERDAARAHRLNERDGRFRSVLGGHFAFARQNPKIETTKNVVSVDFTDQFLAVLRGTALDAQ